MAQETYRLGDLQFDTKEELLAASADLKRINELMKTHDTKNPDEAKKLLAELGSDHGFTTDYGLKFIEKLKKAAGISDSLKDEVSDAKPSQKNTSKEKVNNTAEAKKAKETVNSKPKRQKGARTKIHLLTKRNIIIVAIIAVLAVAGSVLMAVGIIPKPTGCASGASMISETDSHRNLVLQYAKNQLTLRESMITYYKNSQGMTADKAKIEANNILANSYAMNLADENVPSMSDSEIEETYRALMLAGDIEAGGFNEPEAITKLKEAIEQAKASGVIAPDSKTDNQDDTDEAYSADQKTVLLNQMIDYQDRLSIQFACDYNHYGLSEGEIVENVAEDMEKLFVTPVYNALLDEDENPVLSESEKTMYYDSYAKMGLIDSHGPIRLSSSPSYYNLPELTSQVTLNFQNGFSATTYASQQTVAPKAQVTYEFLGSNINGYITLRANGTGSDYIQDDDGNTVIVQGDLYMVLDNQITIGSWYVNSGKIGILVDDTRFGEIECVYNIKY